MHITDDESAKEAIRYISSKGIKTVIITMGAKGALAMKMMSLFTFQLSK